jgi:hypothetical protein
MKAWFLITKQYERVSKVTPDNPVAKTTKMLNLQEVSDPADKDLEVFKDPISVPAPDDLPPGDTTNRICLANLTGYRHGDYGTSFTMKIVRWGGVVDMAAAMRQAMDPQGLGDPVRSNGRSVSPAPAKA